MNNLEAVEAIKRLSKEGKAIKYIRAFLTLEGLEDKLITKLLKEVGVSKSKNSFIDKYKAFLIEASRTEQEALDFINGTNGQEETSNNVKVHKSLYLGYYELAQSVRESVKDSASKPESDDLKKAWDILNAAIKKGKKNRSIHPDKVEYLKNAEITKAYTDFFKKYNG